MHLMASYSHNFAVVHTNQCPVCWTFGKASQSTPGALRTYQYISQGEIHVMNLRSPPYTWVYVCAARLNQIRADKIIQQKRFINFSLNLKWFRVVKTLTELQPLTNIHYSRYKDKNRPRSSKRKGDKFIFLSNQRINGLGNRSEGFLLVWSKPHEPSRRY